MTDEAARGTSSSTRSMATPTPKPISQRSRVSWADEADEEKEENKTHLIREKERENEIHILRQQIEKDMFTKTKKQIMSMKEASKTNRRIGPWPRHWRDLVHDDDGGMDMFGRRPQNGVNTLKNELAKLAFSHGNEWAQDDVSGVELDPELVKGARKVEMTFFKSMKVYTRVPRAMQRMQGGKIIGVRWVDVNKGDKENPDMRSRLVGQEFNTGKDDELYASTPPLEALRFVVSTAATFTDSGIKRHVMINDVKRGYFYAKTTGDI